MIFVLRGSKCDGDHKSRNADHKTSDADHKSRNGDHKSCFADHKIFLSPKCRRFEADSPPIILFPSSCALNFVSFNGFPSLI